MKAYSIIPALSLEDLFKLVLLFTVYLNRQLRFGCRTPVRYILLEQQDMENITYTFVLMQELQALGLRTYPLDDSVRSIKPMVELVAWTLCSDVLA
jgi:hypothetical protein